MRKQVLSAAILAGIGLAGTSSGAIIINEIDSDTANTTAGNDPFEFIELYSTTGGVESLDNTTLALFSGSNATNRSYLVFDLDGRSTGADGFFTIGNAAQFAPGVIDLDTAGFNVIRNGADGVGLYSGDFADATRPTTENLLDAIVYGTDDADDADLMAALGETVQYNEGAHGVTGIPISLSRFPDGSGDFVQAPPTPSEVNVPEPASLALLGFAVGLAFVRRRR
jgi:hypothetical protein